MSETKANRTRNLRYKRPALAMLGYSIITEELYTIGTACDEVRWFVEGDSETLLNALDGDDEAEWEFRMAFSDLSAKCDQLFNAIQENYLKSETFDDCTVGLIGNKYRTIGYDSDEEDYLSLTGYEQDLAYTEAGQRVMRMTKPEMLSTIGQCLGIVVAFLDVRHSYDYLKSTFEILKDENTSLLKIIKEIDAAYNAANTAGMYSRKDECKLFDQMLQSLPDRIWLE